MVSGKKVTDVIWSFVNDMDLRSGCIRVLFEVLYGAYFNVWEIDNGMEGEMKLWD